MGQHVQLRLRGYLTLTSIITFGTKQRLTMATNIHVTVDGCLISPDATTKNLGIVYDSTLSMENQVNAVCRGAYLRLHNISRIRRFLTQDATKTLIQAFVISKLDCGNALLSGVSTNLLRKLQRVQNMSASYAGELALNFEYCSVSHHI